MNYLEFTSERRNRNEWQYPAEFEIEIIQSGDRENKVVLDPVCNSFPIKSWNTSLKPAVISDTITVNLSSIYPVFDIRTIDNRIYIKNIQQDPPYGNLFKTINNYYNGCTFRIDNPFFLTDTDRTIIHYNYNGKQFNYSYEDFLISLSDEIVIYFNEPFPPELFYTNYALTNISIILPTKGFPPTNTVGIQPQIWIPTGSSYDNIYTNHYIQFYSAPSTAIKIISYDGTTKIAILESHTTFDFNNNTPIPEQEPLSGNVLQIKKEKNIILTTINYSISNILQYDFSLPLISDTNIDNFIDLSCGDLYSQEDIGNSQNFINLLYKIKNIQNYTFKYNSLVLLNGVNYVELTETIPDIDYSGMVFSIKTTNSDYKHGRNPYSPNLSYGTDITYIHYNYVIDYYDKTTNRFYLTLPIGIYYDLDPEFLIYIRNITLYKESSISYDNSDFNQFFTYANILPTSYDNYSPILYDGFNFQQDACYEISLVKLVLPNKILVNGGNVFQYPYMYVELQNSTTSINTIYSNNPISNKMLFRVVISDITPPEKALFVKLNGDGMVQTIKFKPNDKFKISIKLPNGELFITDEVDFYSPSPPNPEVQLSVLFSIKKLN